LLKSASLQISFSVISWSKNTQFNPDLHILPSWWRTINLLHVAKRQSQQIIVLNPG
jgi:hypothetical protein